MKRHSFSAALLAVAALIGATLTPSTAAPATAATAPPSHLSWLAAGDSYSSGEGLPHSTGICARANPPASTAWAQAAAADSGLSLAPGSPQLVACTGAPTAQFFTPAGQSPAEWTAQLGTFDLVTFTFGGDNIDFAPIIEQCVGLNRFVSTWEGAAELAGTDTINPNIGPLPSDPGHTCPADSIVRGRITALATTYPAFLTQVAGQAVATGGNIVVVGYPDLVELPQFWSPLERHLGECNGIGTGDATLLRGWAGDLNATIGNAVQTFNTQPAQARHDVTATFVDINSGGSAGISRDDPDLYEPATGTRHNLCGADTWINGVSVIDTFNGSFHPKQAGLDATGQLVRQVLGTLDWTHLAPPPPPTRTEPVVEPVLGQSQSDLGGLGQVKPSRIWMGGDTSTEVWNITWSSWGGAQATGSGTSTFTPPYTTDYPATVVAFDLGICAGRATYQKVEWYFPSLGQEFDPSGGQATCVQSTS